MMMRAFAVIGIAAFAAGIFGQATPQAKFEATDIHSSPKPQTQAMRTIQRGGRYEVRNATMVDLIRTAYGIDAENVTGGPNWVEFDRFDIVAKAANDTPQETLKPMLQALLADRFKLVVHNETKQMPRFVLVQGKGKHKLKEADPSGKPGCPNTRLSFRQVEGGIVPESSASCRNVTMEAFAKELRTMATGYFGVDVIDATALKGAWDFDLKFTPKELGGLGGGDAVSIVDAVDKQLGLKLEERSLPRTVLVIDQANRKPTDNLPDIDKRVPALPPAEFEVATLKPLDPNAPLRFSGSIGVQPGGRFSYPPTSLRTFISMAWSPSNMDDVVGIPKWVDAARFEIVAKLPEEYVPANSTSSAIQDIGPMLQKLLAEQFNMKTHFEDRPVNAYRLTAAKSKLKKADASARTGCKSANSAAFILAGTTSSLPSTQITCQNITMAEFAEQLRTFASSYIRYPVVEATGLEGAWDFSFSFSPINPVQLNAGRPPAAGADAPGASAPVGGTTLFDAVEKQLGLKLEAEKRPYPVLVIDHIEEKSN